MKDYIYQNILIGKKQLRQLLAWSFTNYDSIQACLLADELKYLGFQYASQAGISISIEDLKIPFVKDSMLERANQEIENSERIFLKGKITDVERFQKIIDTWSLTSESLKTQIIYYFKNYDPLNSVYIMAFSGARGNLSQVRQLVGMRGLMSDPSGQIMNLPIKKNFREGLSITDYLMSGYGARKGIVDTALKTANSGYLTRRLIDVSQDILIREKDCLTDYSFTFSSDENIYNKVLGRVLNKPVVDPKTSVIIAKQNAQITPALIQTFKERKITKLFIRSPLTCTLYRAICQKCYGWDLSNENLIDIGEAIGILAGQSIGEPGTQLTMRTFHTGGIFTSEARQQIISPFNAIVQFYKGLKTVVLRTNRGEEVLVTKNAGFLILVPDQQTNELVKIDILRNTILFPKNNQYICKDVVIGEVINTNKQLKNEIKTILSDTSGEIFIPKLKQRVNTLNNNKIIWILSGQLYKSPLNSFINFYPDYKLQKDSYVFRTKLISHSGGRLRVKNRKESLDESLVQTQTNSYLLKNTNLSRFNSVKNNQTHLLTLENFNYTLRLIQKYSDNCLESKRNQLFATLLTNVFKTSTGGRIYYDYKINRRKTELAQSISFFQIENEPKVIYRTMVWLTEEVHQIKSQENGILVENGDFILKNFELAPGHFAKFSGIVTITQKNENIRLISVKAGQVYKSKRLKNIEKKVYYPGEIIFSNLSLDNLSFCEYIGSKNSDQLLIRPITLYEFANKALGSTKLRESLTQDYNHNLKSLVTPLYTPRQHLKGNKSLNLISTSLVLTKKQPSQKIIDIIISKNRITNCVEVTSIEKLNLKNYIPANLKDDDLKLCLLTQKDQFLNSYSLLGFLEKCTVNSQEIVRFKIKKQTEKQIFLISNKDCITVQKRENYKGKVGDIILGKSNLSQTGKIIIENDNFVIIQKGQPYFFPNCKNNNLSSTTSPTYKLFPKSESNITHKYGYNQHVFIDYYNLRRFSVTENLNHNNLQFNPISKKYSLPKFFIKKAGKLYSCLTPKFSQKFALTGQSSRLDKKLLPLYPSKICETSEEIVPGESCAILVHSSDMIPVQKGKSKKSLVPEQLNLLRFMEHPFKKTRKAVGLYAITEDYFEQELNSVFCRNNEFIESGKVIGLLNLEKEITGDIVQGLPRIEEILEARKKNSTIKRIRTSQKKNLVTHKTSLDNNFEFRKIATTIKENDKANPHKLIKAYFNYYGLLKSFFCERTQTFKSGRLINNYEASYKSFKKVQLFILNSVQSVYKSQGVTIDDKHLEVIIKQMTTKVLITYPADAPLLRREVIDLYHIQYINQILKLENKRSACYVPILLGITKAALNNPSFISAASFQETTRVLTTAAIEGRIDWLRGLKENVIIGHLIPAGTGSPNYKNYFKKS